MTTLSDTGLAANTSYSYRVRAGDPSNNLSGYSNIATTVTLAGTQNPTFIQSNYAIPQTPQTTVTVPYTAAQTAGNLNVVVVGWADSLAQVISVTDTRGNVYQLAVGPTLQGQASQSIYYAKNIVGATAGGNSAVVTFSPAAAAPPDIRILEYSGIDPVSPLDVAVGASSNGATSNSGVVTTTNASDLLIGANDVATSTSGPGAGFTQRILTSPNGDIVRDRIVTATGSYSATAPLGSAGGWVMQMVAFRPAGSGPPDTTPPTVPTNLTATPAGSAQINLSWTPSTDAGHPITYRVERCQGAGCANFVEIATPVATTLNNTGLTANTSYSYRVRAGDPSSNLSGYSNIATAATPPAPDTTPPTVPTNLTATPAGSTQINLSWTASTDASSPITYRVERCQGAGCANFVEIATPVLTTLNNTGLTANTSYSYRVRAGNPSSNLSGYSNVATAATPPAADTTPPTVPTNLTARPAGGASDQLVLDGFHGRQQSHHLSCGTMPGSGLRPTSWKSRPPWRPP